MPNITREQDGEAVDYRGFSIVPMRECVTDGSLGGRKTRNRCDILERVPPPDGGEPLVMRVKTCASLVSAKGWIDAFAIPAER